MTTATERCKGQEVVINIAANGVLQDTLTEVEDFEGTLQFEVIAKGYLGERTNRKDMIYNGAKFSFSMDTFTQDIWFFVAAVKALAQRSAPGNYINVTGTFEYANGDTPSMLFGNCQFGEMPVTVAKRNEYVKHKFSGETDDVTISTS
jgi:hypothetical protein